MNDYKQFQKQQGEFEKDANTKHETTGIVVHWFFLLVCAAISAGASYLIGHRGLSGNPFYERFIGAQNAALLVVVALDGSFLALLAGMATFLKTTEQRALARRALVVIKLILIVNVVGAFLISQSAATLPIISTYMVYGSPLVIGATLWLWSSLFSKRRKNQMMANALDTIALRDQLWAQQYITDQQRNKTAYDLVASSPAMAALRSEGARRKAIEDVATQFGLSFDEAEVIYNAAEDERQRQRDERHRLIQGATEQRQIAQGGRPQTEGLPRVVWQGNRIISDERQGPRGN